MLKPIFSVTNHSKGKTLSVPLLLQALVILTLVGPPMDATAQQFIAGGDVKCMYIPTYDQDDFTDIENIMISRPEWIRQMEVDGTELIPDQSERYTASSATGPDAMLFNKALHALPRGKPKHAAQALWALLKEHPNSSLAQQASFLIADAYFDMFSQGLTKTLEPTINAYDRAIDQYPHSRDVHWARYQVARCNKKMRLYYEAIALYRIGMENGLPETWIPWYALDLGKVLIKTNRLDEAKEQFAEVLRRAPGGDLEKEALFGLSECYCLLGDIDSAEDAYKEAMLGWPGGVVGRPVILFKLGDHYLKKGDYKEAQSYLLYLLNLYPDRPFSGVVMVYIGDTYRFQDNLSLAKDLYEEVIRSLPAEDTAYQIARFRMADMVYLPQASSFTFGKVGPELLVYHDIANDSSSTFIAQYAQYRYALGLYSHAGTMSAIDELEAFIDHYPESPLRKDVYKALKDIFHQLVQCWSDASDLLSTAIFYERHRQYLVMPPLDMRMIDVISDSYQRLGLYSESLNVYRDCITEGGEQIEIESFAFKEIQVKSILDENEDVTEVGNYFLNSFRRSKKCAQVNVFTGDAYYNLEDYPTAVDHYSKALEQDPKMEGTARIYYRKGNAHRALEEYGPAIQAYEKAIEAAAQYHFIVDDLYVAEESIYQKAFTLYDAGEYARAAEAFTTAHAAYPRNARAPIALYRRGDSFQRLGRQKEAVQAWKEMMHSYPEDLWRKLGEERIGGGLAKDAVAEEAPRNEGAGQ